MIFSLLLNLSIKWTCFAYRKNTIEAKVERFHDLLDFIIESWLFIQDNFWLLHFKFIWRIMAETFIVLKKYTVSNYWLESDSSRSDYGLVNSLWPVPLPGCQKTRLTRHIRHEWDVTQNEIPCFFGKKYQNGCSVFRQAQN